MDNKNEYEKKLLKNRILQYVTEIKIKNDSEAARKISEVKFTPNKRLDILPS